MTQACPPLMVQPGQPSSGRWPQGAKGVDRRALQLAGVLTSGSCAARCTWTSVSSRSQGAAPRSQDFAHAAPPTRACALCSRPLRQLMSPSAGLSESWGTLE